jgi:hypothetical protein
MKLQRRDVLRLGASTAATALTGCGSAAPPKLAASPQQQGNAMKSRPLMTLRLTTAPTQVVGATPHGKRVTFPVIGGTFEGDRLRGKVLPDGDDWTVQRSDGAMELDLRVTLETDDGAFIYMTFSGLRDDAHAYFHTLPRFETAAPKYSFLNRILAIGTGEVGPNGPQHVIEEVL